MREYLVRRLLILIPVFFLITVINFFLMNLMPGDAVDAMIDPRMRTTLDKDALEARRRSLGLDKSIPERYVIWIGEVARGNLGFSFYSRKPVLDELGNKIVNTLKLQAIAFVVAVVVGLLLGVYAALHQYSVFDYVSTLVSYLFASIPVFFVALLAVYGFAVTLDIFPTSGTRTLGDDPSLADELHHLALPVIVLSLGSWSVLMRYTRTSVLEVLSADYVNTAKAKGIRWPTVVRRHALRNALLPLITIIALSVPGIIGGSVLVETVFDWPGMGQASVLAIGRRDYPLMMGVMVVFSIAVLLSNLIADLSYAFADPRIRLR
jgi:peptide/nickel transport system permease protein